MKDYTQVERDNAALTIREYAFGQMNMLRMLGDEDAANNLQEAINMAVAALRGPEWVRTVDRLPELGTPVLATDNIEIDIAMFSGSGKWSTENWNDWEGVVAWTPLPAMPETGGEDEK